MDYHPKTGLHYFHVLRDYPAFLEVFASYQQAATRIPWMTAVVYKDVPPAGSPLWDDPRIMFIFWTCLPTEAPRGFRAKVALHYTESTDKPEDKNPIQQGLYRTFLDDLQYCDLLFAHTPSAREVLRPFGKKVALAPVGCEPNVLGTPKWGSDKKYDIAFYGNRFGRRLWILPALEKHFGDRMIHIEHFGAKRQEILEASRVTLYVLHSRDSSGATSRLWQVASTSSAMVIERSDVWPARPGLHYLEVDPADEANLDRLITSLESILKRPDLERVARQAHAHLWRYTVERCMQEFIVPASMEIL